MLIKMWKLTICSLSKIWFFNVAGLSVGLSTYNESLLGVAGASDTSLSFFKFSNNADILKFTCP